MRLFGCDDVALEKNDSAGLEHREAIAELRREFRSIETEDEKLADLGAKIRRGFLHHDSANRLSLVRANLVRRNHLGSHWEGHRSKSRTGKRIEE